jgi:hypothetical protein
MHAAANVRPCEQGQRAQLGEGLARRVGVQRTHAAGRPGVESHEQVERRGDSVPPRSVAGGAVALEHQRGNPATRRELNPVRSSPGAHGLRVVARGERGAQLGRVVVVEVDLVGHTVQPEAGCLPDRYTKRWAEPTAPLPSNEPDTRSAQGRCSGLQRRPSGGRAVRRTVPDPVWVGYWVGVVVES